MSGNVTLTTPSTFFFSIFLGSLLCFRPVLFPLLSAAMSGTEGRLCAVSLRVESGGVTTQRKPL